MKARLIALILILAMALPLAACDGEPPVQPDDTTVQTPSQTDKPSDETDKPSDGTDKPSDGTDKPSDGTDEPSDGTDEPSDETDKPSDGTDKPSDETDKPGDPVDKDRLKADLVAALRELLTGSSLDPYSMIPETMRIDYRENLVDPAKLTGGYASNVAISDIPTQGNGEQWRMVLDNLEQSKAFFNVLSVLEGVTTISVQTFEAFFDKNPEETAIHTFEESIYSVTIRYDDKTLAYVLDYTAKLPVLGEQKVQIALSMDRQTREKHVRIQLGNANSLAYTFTEDSYTFALTYMNVRHAYFSIERDEDGSIYGHINEFITVESLQIQSAADFYITEEYVTAVGNKADGMLLFDGRVCELYRVEDGRLVGYEVKETESLLGLEFDTLWFDLSALGGMTSIRYAEKTDDTEAGFCVNNSKNLWKPMKVGLFNPSRRFDIEFRTRYYTVYNAEEEAYEVVSAQVPMLFVQEEYLESLSKDVKSENGINISLGVDGDELVLLMNQYDLYVPAFDDHKAAITTDSIMEFIGKPVSFS